MIKIDSFRLHKTSAATRPKKEEGVKNFKDLNPALETQPFSHSQQISSLSGLASLDELLQLQNVGLESFGGVRTEENGKKILKELDKLRLNLLTGELSAAELQHLSQIVNQNLTPAQDPQLNSIIKEIEQRLAIELTKLEMSRS